MERSHELLEYPEGIVHDLLEELQMADQHLTRAQKPMCEPSDLRYFLLWCRKHIERTKSLLEKLRRDNGSV
jgi:hypothetical protein